MPYVSSATHTAASLIEVSRQLTIVCSGIQAAAMSMQEHGVASVEVQQHKALERALNDLDRFGLQVRSAVREALQSRGILGQVPPNAE